MPNIYRIQLDGQIHTIQSDGPPPTEAELRTYLAQQSSDPGKLEQGIADAQKILAAPKSPAELEPVKSATEYETAENAKRATAVNQGVANMFGSAPPIPPPQDPIDQSGWGRAKRAVGAALTTPLAPKIPDVPMPEGAYDPQVMGLFGAPPSPAGYNAVIQPQTTAPGLALALTQMGLLPKLVGAGSGVIFGGENLKNAWEHYAAPDEGGWQKAAGITGNTLMAIAALAGAKGDLGAWRAGRAAGAPAAAEAAATELGANLRQPTMAPSTPVGPGIANLPIEDTADAMPKTIPVGPGAAPGEVATAVQSQPTPQRLTPLGWWNKPTQAGAVGSWTEPVAPGMVKGADGQWHMVEGRPGGTSTSMELPLQDFEATGAWDRRASPSRPGLAPEPPPPPSAGAPGDVGTRLPPGPEGAPGGAAEPIPEPTYAPGEDNTIQGLRARVAKLIDDMRWGGHTDEGDRMVDQLHYEIRRREAAMRTPSSTSSNRGAIDIKPLVRLGTTLGGGLTAAAAPDQGTSTEDRIVAGIFGAGFGYAVGNMITGDGSVNAAAAADAFRVGKSALQVLAPQSGVFGKAAQLTGSLLQASGGRLARAQDVARAAFKPFDKVINALPEGERIQFMKDMDVGRPTRVAALRPLQRLMEAEFKQRASKLEARGLMENFVEDYFPHLWKNQGLPAGTVAEDMAAPTRGSTRGVSAAFMKGRTVKTIEEGLDPNRPGGPLELLTTNPIDAALIRIKQMDRLLQLDEVRTGLNAKGWRVNIHTAAEDMARGAGVPVETVAGRKPAGWDYDPSDPAAVAKGWVIPSGAARVLRYHMGEGAFRGNAGFDAFRGISNAMNQLSLSFSGFHAGFTALESSISTAAAANQALLNPLADLALGRPSMTMGRYVTEALPLAGRLYAKAVIPFYAPIENIIKGDKAMEQWLKSTPDGAYWKGVINQLMQGGARAGLDDFYQGFYWRGFKEALGQGQVDKALWKGLAAAPERAAAPLMQWAIPRLKFGAFMDLAQVEMQRLGPAATEEAMTAVLQRAWNSIDNRFGQLVYENLFLQPGVKDALMATTRAVGWNIGSIRELGGGVTDVARTIGRVAGGGQALTPRTAYAVTALMPMTALFAGIYQFLHTGEMPQNHTDWFAPRTGQLNEDGDPERVVLPTYLTRDLQSFLHDPLKTIADKTHPTMSAAAALIKNEDWKGTQIYNPKDSLLGRKGLDMVEYLGQQAMPITLENILEQRAGRARAGPGGWGSAAAIEPKLEQFFGLNPEPKWFTREPGLQTALELKAESAPKVRTRGEEAYNETRRFIRQGLQRGDIKPLQDAIDSGALPADKAYALVKGSSRPAILAVTQGMRPDQLLDVYKASRNERDKELLKPGLTAWVTKLGTYPLLPPEERSQLIKEIIAVLKPPQATEPLTQR